MTTDNNISAIDNGQGQSLLVVGDSYRILISGKQTGGNYAVIDMLVPPGDMHEPPTWRTYGQTKKDSGQQENTADYLSALDKHC